MPFSISLARIAETEAAMEVTFPAMFKARMSRMNGGEVEIEDELWFLYPFFDTTDRKTIGRTCNDIRRETERARTWGGFPPDGVAIAHDGGGGWLLLRPDGGALGRTVWVYRRHEHALAEYIDDVADLWSR